MKYEKEQIDYLCIGLGASNCLLILALEKRGLLANKKLVIIEPHQKNKKDKTYCFWSSEEEVNQIIPTNFIDKKWDNVIINGRVQNLSPLSYYHVSSLTLYENALEVVKKYRGVVIYETLDVSDKHSIVYENKRYQAVYVFDSRPPEVDPTNKHHFYINQSFVGWQIQTETPFFDSDSFTMMDFEVPQDDATQFVYVLPFDSKNALIEVTRFGKDIMTNEAGEELLKTYLKNIPNYHLTHTEQGCIPMTNIPLSCESDDHVRHMGARAGHVKPSTGYAFKSMSQDANLITEQIKNGIKSLPSSPVQKRTNRFAFYDSLLLRILAEKPYYGKPIFKRLFDAIKATSILDFLDEKSILSEEITIFYSLQWKPFLWAAIKEVFKPDSFIFKSLIPLLLTVTMIVFNQIGLSILSNGLLIFGLIAIGIPHGALDHILETNSLDQPITFKFVAFYLFQAALILLLWYINPLIALGLFLAYSIYHFAQSDYQEWNLNSKNSWIWGISFLSGILLGHPQELSVILDKLSISPLPTLNGYILNSFWSEIACISILICLILSTLNQKMDMIVVSLSILIALKLPLLQAFGIYFIFHHSYVGWNHLKLHFEANSLQLWKKGSIFSLGAFILFGLTWWAIGDDWGSYVGTFFVFLSAISFPHIVRMHHFYSYFQKNGS